MSQWWKLVNIDGRVEVKHLRHLETVLKTLSEHESNSRKAHSLRTASIGHTVYVDTPSETCVVWNVQLTILSSASNIFGTLPQELLDNVLHLLNDDAILCLALVSTSFYRLLFQRLRYVILQLSSLWPNDRMTSVNAPAFSTGPGVNDRFDHRALASQPPTCRAPGVVGARGYSVKNRLYCLVQGRDPGETVLCGPADCSLTQLTDVFEKEDYARFRRTVKWHAVNPERAIQVEIRRKGQDSGVM